jgi:C-terminal processing protease CtpA/Prc
MSNLGWHMKCTMRFAWFALAGSLVLASCGGGGVSPAFAPSADSCTDSAKKNFVLAAAREWYLFTDLLPATIDPAAFATPDAFLDGLTATARSQSKDRGFSFITSISAEQSTLGAGTSIGFGVSLRTLTNNTRIIVGQVFEGSAAADAGFVRGDEILAVGDSVATLQSASSVLASAAGITGALGASTVGLSRVFRIKTPAGLQVDRSVAKREFNLNPVNIVRIINRPGLSPVGYLSFRTFVSPADAQLRSAFASFKAAGARDVVIDMRYNGGGLVTTAELLMNLFAGDRTNQVAYSVKYNPAKASSESTVRFTAQPETANVQRIAFIATDSTASASELVINALTPYAGVAIIGAKTFGKPVGQNAYDIGGCDFRLRLVAFKTANRDGHTDFFNGLPDAAFTGDFCAATDDFSQAIGADAESMTSDALYWINNSSCRIPGVLGLQKAQLYADATAPALSGAVSPLQIYLPGSY